MKNRLVKLLRSPTLKVMLLTFVGMLLGLLADILIAAKLGTSISADALIIALSLPRISDIVWREGTRFSLVPLFLQYKDKANEQEYNRFVSGIVNLSLVVGLLIALVLAIFAPLIVIGLAPGFSSEGRSEAAFLLQASAPMALFAPPIAVLSVVLNSQKRFSVVALRNAAAPALVVAAIAFTWNFKNISLWVALAYSVGFAAFFVMVFIDAFKAGHQHQWKAWVSKEDLSSLWEAGFLPTFGFILRQMANLIRSQLLPSLVGVGGVSMLYFAMRVVSAAQTLLGISIATTSLPAMTEDDLAGKKSRLGSALRRNLKSALLITVPATLFIALFNQQIIEGLYGRGSFGEASIQQTSDVFLWFGMGLVFACIIPLLEAGLYAQRKYLLLFYTMVSMSFVGVFMSWLFLQWQGLAGIAMGASLMLVINVGVILYFLEKTGVSLFAKFNEK